jgi:hypothetical protein
MYIDTHSCSAFPLCTLTSFFFLSSKKDAQKARRGGTAARKSDYTSPPSPAPLGLLLFCFLSLPFSSIYRLISNTWASFLSYANRKAKGKKKERGRAIERSSLPPPSPRKTAEKRKEGHFITLRSTAWSHSVYTLLPSSTLAFFFFFCTSRKLHQARQRTTVQTQKAATKESEQQQTNDTRKRTTWKWPFCHN